MNNLYTIIFGTRPEYLKMKKIIDIFYNNNQLLFQVIFIKQHNNIEDLNINKKINFFSFEINNISENRIENIGSEILQKLPKFLKDSTHLIIQGDTATTFYSALVAFQRNIKIIHLEAGLRTYDLEKPFPEEGYRQMVSRLATFHFTPHDDCSENLKKEGIIKSIYNVGNTIIDLIKSYNLNVVFGDKVIITLHRRENWNDLNIYINHINLLADKYKELEFIWVLHPNKEIQKIVKGELLKSITIIDPINHYEFSKLIASCYCLLTDSGGIQEEASYLGKQCIVLRKSTERSHIGYPYIQTINDFKDIENIFKSIKKEVLLKSLVYGDGTTCEKIYNVLKSQTF